MKISYLSNPEERRIAIPFLEELNVNFGSNPLFDFAGKEVFVAWEKGEAAGFGNISYDDDMQPVFRYDLVDPFFRGRKIQKKLIEARIEFLKKVGHRQAHVFISPSNLYSLNNYVDCGFRFDDEELIMFKDEVYQSLKYQIV